MKKHIVTAILLIASIGVFAQKEHALVVNFNAHQNAFTTFNSSFKNHIGFPSIEYQRRKGKKILSLELAKITWKKSPTYEWDRTRRIHIYSDRNFQAIGRIQWIRLLRDSSKKVQPYLGASLSPFYARTKRIPMLSSYFPQTFSSVGVNHHFSIGSFYNFGKYFINANALVGIGSLAVEKSNILNPGITQQEQVSSRLAFDLFNQDYLFRIGIGMLL